ncbi:MAG: hypothetical protein ACE5GO_11310, partial [Anaerolineales bacterium]
LLCLPIAASLLLASCGRSEEGRQAAERTRSSAPGLSATGQIEAAVKKLRAVMDEASDKYRDQNGLRT